MLKKYLININNELVGLRLDVAITKKVENMTRSFLKEHLKMLKVNDKNEKLSYKSKVGDIVYVEVEEVENIDITPEDIPLDIIYEDKNYIVINKPYGMVVHPAKGNYRGTLVNALMGLKKNLSNTGDVSRLGIVHRLDKDTSGLIIIAKNNQSHSYLQELFAKRMIIKRYHAIVKGFFSPSKITIENIIGRNPNNRKKMAVVASKGKIAITQVVVRKRVKNYSYLNINLKTGRTHQIRVHLSHFGFPILGDPIYSRKDAKFKDIPLCLVAYRISFFDKFSNKQLEFRIDDPIHFKKILD
ncbi:MAG TPA: RluA family pseudouridine synthase [Spirochaetota bacterium]|nr:RluA family pseudouridine synthase [Spirochaetota bacterium]